jgi:hypothetical protein
VCPVVVSGKYLKPKTSLVQIGRDLNHKDSFIVLLCLKLMVRVIPDYLNPFVSFSPMAP